MNTIKPPLTHPMSRGIAAASLVAILLFLPLSLFAQSKPTFRVASFAKDPTRTTAISDEYKKKDKSQHLYSIIHVTSNNPGDDLSAYRFEFAQVSEFQEIHGNELWVYVQMTARQLTITRQGFENVRYTLPQKIEEGMDYIMQLATSGAVFTRMVEFHVKPAIEKATVMIKSNKAGAKNEQFGITDASGAVAKSLELGTYSYEVYSDNYHTSQGIITLTRGKDNHIEEVTLKPNFGEVTLKVAGDAEIFLNGQSKGRGSWSGTLKAGNYAVECRQVNHRPSSQYITIAENDTSTFTLNPPIPITGTLAVITKPLGASITIDGKDYGKSPRNIDGLIIGQHTVTLNLKNHKPEARAVEIKENQTTNLDVQLSDFANQTIRSKPSGAELFIDGKNVGTTPYTAEMPSGDYQVRLVYKGYRTYDKSLHLDSSHPDQTINLQRQYQSLTCGYIALGFSAPSLMGPTATIGMYIHNVNLEGTFFYGIKESDEIYWNSSGTQRPITCRYKPMAFGGKVGYGITFGTRLRLTPQAGVMLVSIKSKDEGSGSSRCNVLQASVGARLDFAMVNHLGIFVAPEYGLAVSKSSIYQQIAPLSSKIKAWGDGFNVRAGLTVFF